MNIKIGIDPELFFFNKLNKSFVPAIGLIPGNKEEPHPIGNGCAIQVDNCSVEFNTPATDCDKQFKAAINYVKNYLNSLYANLEAQAVPTVIFEEQDLQHPDAWVFGCDPDYDAYALLENPKPTSANKFKRTAGGHIHFGYDNHDQKKNIEMIKLADLYLGIPSLFMDADKERRELYGKSGAHRPKPYGVEYRTLSNFWVGDDALIDWTFEQSMRVAESLGKITLTDAEHAMVRFCINNNNENLAKTLVKKFNLKVM